MSATGIEYTVETVTTHHRTSDHTGAYFQEVLERHASEGWRLHSVVEISSLRWLMIFERNK